MTPPSDEIADILSPFFDHFGAWTLHYPFYLNTFCLAYHIAQVLKHRGIDPALFRHSLIRNEWWHGRPRFTYHSDVEIFVGVKETISHLKSVGHNVKLSEALCFTKYKVNSMFQRRDPGQPLVNVGIDDKVLLIGDVKTTAEFVRDNWINFQCPWPYNGSYSPEKISIRNAWDREMGDFFSIQPKFYIFGAPMRYLLHQNSITVRDNGKYNEHQLPATLAIPTFYCFRRNSGTNARVFNELRAAIKRYYDALFSRSEPTDLIDITLPDHYARAAMTSGDPNPFPEVYGVDPTAKQDEEAARALQQRYREILTIHHAQP